MRGEGRAGAAEGEGGLRGGGGFKGAAMPLWREGPYGGAGRAVPPRALLCAGGRGVAALTAGCDCARAPPLFVLGPAAGLGERLPGLGLRPRCPRSGGGEAGSAGGNGTGRDKRVLVQSETRG